MKIGIDVRLWNETGVGRYIRNLIKNLAVLDTDNEYVLFVREKDFSQVALITSNNMAIVKANIAWHSLSEQILFKRLLDRQRLDLVHFPYFSLPIMYKKPYVVTIHDLIINNFSTGKASTLPFPLYYVKKKAYQRVIKDAISNASAVIVPSEYVKKDIENRFDIERIYVTREGVDESLKRTQDSENLSYLNNIPFFLYVGNAYPHKNVEFLIESFIKLKKESRLASAVHLVLVGREDYFYRRMKRADFAKYSVLFLHSVDDLDLAFLYTHALALIAPSISEGFGLTTIEAMKLSCLVVASNIPTFREICGKWALYFDPRHQDALMARLESVLAMDKIEKNMYIKGALKNIVQFSWKKMAEETIEIYESCNNLRSGE